MPRWKALPDELDPQVREFASQLRRLVDRSGLSIAAVSDRTGYSKTSWERYLNGRLLAPKGAIVALAEVTGTNPVHLITMWELAERAWSRSEARHDMTMQAIRISQARAALGELGPNPPKDKGNSGAARNGAGAGAGSGSVSGAGVDSADRPDRPASSDRSDRPDRPGSAGGSFTGVAGPAGVSPTVPPQTPSYGPVGGSGGGGGGDLGAFGAAPGTHGPGHGGDSPDRQRRRRKLTMFLAGVVGALVVIAAAVFLTDFGKDDKSDESAKPSATPTASDKDLPAGVECTGKSCTGKDPETMGCGGELASTTTRATVGKALIEVRYSKTCGAAWARITQAAPGDKVTISGEGAAKANGTVNADFDAYTPMVAVKDGASAEACATLKAGQTGCTK
ncbi:XRE family transcriptional regulator [Streptomyces sp. NPDC056486]|uniref:XRE family transcriptional regulator n=1 Tax=Streptomyces sp. NPDC056486 TaxID=3345835 RepID=UPI0036AAB444